MSHTRTFLLLLFVLPITTAFAADKTGPDFLRRKHAGMATLSSTKPIEALYPDLLKAAQECHTLRIAPGAGTGAPSGAVGGIQSASREVSGKMSPDGQSAYVAVTVVGFFGATRSNFLQIDIESRDDGTNVVVFHRNNVKAQRGFITEVKQWLDGDLTFCEPKPLMVKDSAKKAE
jgi:hypothetical protein